MTLHRDGSHTCRAFRRQGAGRSSRQRYIGTFARRPRRCQLALPAPSSSCKHLMLLWREFGPAFCRVFNRSSPGENAKSPGVLLFPGKKQLLNSGCWLLDRLAQLRAAPHLVCALSSRLHPPGSAGQGAKQPAARQHLQPLQSTQLALPTTTADLHTRDRFFPLDRHPAQPPRLRTKQKQELGNYMVLNGAALMRFFFMTSAGNCLCSVLCWSK